MAYLDLNLFRHPSGMAFDPAVVIEKLKKAFPEAEVLPGDQLALRAQQAETRADQLSPESARTVVETLWRNARLYGPAYGFAIPVSPGTGVRGTARRYNVTFLFEEPLTDAVRDRLTAFLHSLSVGKLEFGRSGQRPEVLCDMPGNPEVRNGLPEGRAVVHRDSEKDVS